MLKFVDMCTMCTHLFFASRVQRAVLVGLSVFEKGRHKRGDIRSIPIFEMLGSLDIS